jgi:hypothetical protein
VPKNIGHVEVEVMPRHLHVTIDAAGADAYRVLKALGQVEPPNPKQVRTVIMTVGPVTEQE